MKKLTVILAILLCLSMTACQKEKKDRIPPTRSTDPIFNTEDTTSDDKAYRSSVYVTVYGDTAYLATYPYEIDDEELEMECSIREISKGGTILCGGTHEQETPITTVVILDALGPDSTVNWFRNMTHLRKISGLSNLIMDNVTDMSYMFSGCTRLDSIQADNWNVPEGTKMTGMFDGCDAMAVKPVWYKE